MQSLRLNRGFDPLDSLVSPQRVHQESQDLAAPNRSGVNARGLKAHTSCKQHRRRNRIPEVCPTCALQPPISAYSTLSPQSRSTIGSVLQIVVHAANKAWTETITGSWSKHAQQSVRESCGPSVDVWHSPPPSEYECPSPAPSAAQAHTPHPHAAPHRFPDRCSAPAQSSSRAISVPSATVTCPACSE